MWTWITANTLGNFLKSQNQYPLLMMGHIYILYHEKFQNRSAVKPTNEGNRRVNENCTGIGKERE